MPFKHIFQGYHTKLDISIQRLYISYKFIACSDDDQSHTSLDNSVQINLEDYGYVV